MNQVRTETTPPSAKALVLSMRAMGYQLHTALADLIDNSIFAKAKNIQISWGWDDGNPWIMIFDDGKGMTEAELREAMKPGGQSPEDTRDLEDLGRFSLGLKTASWSQCKLMSVMSKTSAGDVSTRQWDLGVVEKHDRWDLIVDLDTVTKLKMHRRLDVVSSGTVILWEKLDRIIGEGDASEQYLEDSFNEKFTGTVLPHLQMIFHQFLTGKDAISMKVGNTRCIPWDPFLTEFTSVEERPTETFGQVVVTPYIMPHSSNLTMSELQKAQGPWGWLAQQGFYVYRNKRMIIAGGYLGLIDENGKHFEAKDQYRLCRIKVDIPNDLDHEWDLDVKKAQASPPLRLRREFERLARSTREKSSQVYRRRSIARKLPGESAKADIWHRRKIGEKIVYKVNRESPAIVHLCESAELSKTHLNALLHLIERTVPYRGITIDNNEITDSTVDLPDNIEKPPPALVELAVEVAKKEIKRGKQPKNAVDFVCQIVFQLDSPQLRIALEKEILGV